jgi:hypothetical protein
MVGWTMRQLPGASVHPGRLVPLPSATPPIPRPKPFAEEPETAEEHERRRQQYYEIFGSYDSFGPPEKPKRRWRRH